MIHPTSCASTTLASRRVSVPAYSPAKLMFPLLKSGVGSTAPIVWTGQLELWLIEADVEQGLVGE